MLNLFNNSYSGFDSGDHQGNATPTPYVGWDYVVGGKDRDPTHRLAVLQTADAWEAFRRTEPRSPDAQLEHRLGIEGQDSRMCRLPVPATQKHRPQLSRSIVECSSTSGGSSSRTRTTIHQERSSSCSKRGGRGEESQGDDQGRSRQRARRRQDMEREAEGRSKRKRQGQREETRQRRRRSEEGLLGRGVEDGCKLLDRGAREKTEEETKKKPRQSQWIGSFPTHPGGTFEIPGQADVTGANCEDSAALGAMVQPTNSEVSLEQSVEPAQFLVSPQKGNAAAGWKVQVKNHSGFASRCFGGKKVHLADSDDRCSAPQKKVKACASEAKGSEMLSALCNSSFYKAIPFIESMLISSEKRLRHGETKPTGDVFPLPTSLDVLKGVANLKDEQLKMLRCLCLGLNSYAGVTMESSGTVSSFRRSC